MLTIRYNLSELPTSQHRAGLAGLMLLANWIDNGPEEWDGDLALDAEGATLYLTAKAVAQLLDLVYAASTQPGKTPKDEPRVIPTGEAISDGAGYIKLWRDVTWSVFRGVPTTRGPFTSRLDGKAYDADAREAFEALGKRPNAPVSVTGSSLLGAQARTSELVPWRDSVKAEFLLHFWPFAVGIYVTQTFDAERGYNFSQDFIVTVPDVCNLAAFVEAETIALGQRGTEMSGYRPSSVVVSSMEEAGLAASLRMRMAGGARTVLGFDLFRVGREGKNVRVFESGRSTPPEAVVIEYTALHEQFHDPTFRAQRVENMVRGKEWHHGFGRLYESTEAVERESFRRDANTAMEAEVEESLAMVVRDMVRNFLCRRAEKRLRVTWKAIRDRPDAVAKFNADCRTTATSTYYEVRGRRGAAGFRELFVERICGVPTWMNEPRYLFVAEALEKRPMAVRDLTLIALSAQRRARATDSETTTPESVEKEIVHE